MKLPEDTKKKKPSNPKFWEHCTYLGWDLQTVSLCLKISISQIPFHTCPNPSTDLGRGQGRWAESGAKWTQSQETPASSSVINRSLSKSRELKALPDSTRSTRRYFTTVRSQLWHFFHPEYNIFCQALCLLYWHSDKSNIEMEQSIEHLNWTWPTTNNPPIIKIISLH